MGSNISIISSVIILSTVMFLASLQFKDKEGELPARFFFRMFYFCAVLFFIAIAINLNQPSKFTDVLSDFCVALTNACLTIGILWRCKSSIPIKVIYILAGIYLVADGMVDHNSVQIAYSYNVICSLICVYSLLNRQGGANIGDKGMAFVILVNAVLILVNLISFTGVIEPEYYQPFMTMIFVFAPAYLAGLTIFLFSSYMLDAHKELEYQAITDPMTGLYNRRFFLKEAKRLLKSAERHQEKLCILMCDIDHFKEVNDRYGHKVGDYALNEFSSILEKSLRVGDVLARYGGEEFVALLPQTDKEKALHVAERMRAETEKLRIETAKGAVQLTASFGVCQVKEFCDIEISINQADKAMYEAKSAGRNVVKSFTEALI